MAPVYAGAACKATPSNRTPPPGSCSASHEPAETPDTRPRADDRPSPPATHPTSRTAPQPAPHASRDPHHRAHSQGHYGPQRHPHIMRSVRPLAADRGRVITVDYGVRSVRRKVSRSRCRMIASEWSRARRTRLDASPPRDRRRDARGESSPARSHVSDSRRRLGGHAIGTCLRFAADGRILGGAYGKRCGKWTRLPALWLESRVLRVTGSVRSRDDHTLGEGRPPIASTVRPRHRVCDPQDRLVWTLAVIHGQPQDSFTLEFSNDLGQTGVAPVNTRTSQTPGRFSRIVAMGATLRPGCDAV
jgi:hypothetical protein